MSLLLKMIRLKEILLSHGLHIPYEFIEIKLTTMSFLSYCILTELYIQKNQKDNPV